jgi:undecaprenyl diphosphate synthase
MKFRRIPDHIGIIPDGNRRWAKKHGLPKESGYERGIEPGFRLYSQCLELGIRELTFYGFTQDNTKRPSAQRKAFQKACVDSVIGLASRNASLLVVGNSDSPMFPPELISYTGRRTVFGKGSMRVNLLVNYGWQWDMKHLVNAAALDGIDVMGGLASSDISRIDLLIRWGGRRRLSGFLPLQTVYSDFYILDALWPDFEEDHLLEALRWYDVQDITLGG